MIHLQIKPLSVNKSWQGRRFKTKEYSDYERDVLRLLPKIKVPKGKIRLEVCFGLSNKASDIDNPIKPLIDILQKAYEFNDKQIYSLFVIKCDVKRGDEFININLLSL